MSVRTKRKLAALAVALAAGTVFQAYPTGCASYYATGGLSAFDFCAVLNCTGTSFFNFCQPVPLLVDCPEIAAQ